MRAVVGQVIQEELAVEAQVRLVKVVVVQHLAVDHQVAVELVVLIVEVVDLEEQMDHLVKVEQDLWHVLLMEQVQAVAAVTTAAAAVELVVLVLVAVVAHHS